MSAAGRLAAPRRCGAWPAARRLSGWCGCGCPAAPHGRSHRGPPCRPPSGRAHSPAGAAGAASPRPGCPSRSSAAARWRPGSRRTSTWRAAAPCRPPANGTGCRPRRAPASPPRRSGTGGTWPRRSRANAASASQPHARGEGGELDAGSRPPAPGKGAEAGQPPAVTAARGGQGAGGGGGHFAASPPRARPSPFSASLPLSPPHGGAGRKPRRVSSGPFRRLREGREPGVGRRRPSSQGCSPAAFRGS